MEDQLTFVARVDLDRVAVADFATQHAAGERVLNQSLNRAECGRAPNCELSIQIELCYDSLGDFLHIARR